MADIPLHIPAATDSTYQEGFKARCCELNHGESPYRPGTYTDHVWKSGFAAADSMMRSGDHG